MVGKVQLRSYAAKSSRQVRRRCPKCRRDARAECVDYGPGGVLLFCECGNVRESKVPEARP